MKKSNLIIAFSGLILALSLSGCASVIRPGYKGMMYVSWGKGLKTDKIYDDGWVWKWPWSRVIKYNVQWKRYQIKVPLLTSDELHVTINTSVILRPNPKNLPPLELEVGRMYYDNVVKPAFVTITRNVFSIYSHKEMTVKGSEIEDEIRKRLRIQLKGKHIDIDRVTLDHIMYSPLVTKAVDRKLATQQEVEQKEYEMQIAGKDAEIQRILARGQKDAQQIINEHLTTQYLQFKALEVQTQLAKSPNAKFYFIPIGKDGIPLIIDAGSK